MQTLFNYFQYSHKDRVYSIAFPLSSNPCFVPDYLAHFFTPMAPGSGIGLVPALGFRIPNPYFLELCDNFLGKKYYV